MVKKKKRYSILIIIIIILAIAASRTVLLPGLNGKQLTKETKIVQGELDMTEWEPQRDGVIKLAGAWSFYWERLLTTDDFNRGDTLEAGMYVDVPNVWNHYQKEGKHLPGNGYGTYRVKVKTDGKAASLALKIPIMSTAYKVIIDGKTVAVNGEVAETKDRAVAAYLPQTIVFQPTAKEFDIVVQVSNYLYARGGMWFALRLGTEGQIAGLNKEEFAIEMIIWAVR
ncbi:hypothetical protein [Paenibacillus sp. N3.4]|uniref:hypothetical protein n=1 Tax=Paenibacillus sp. N3.4 TaxID=2603222 RepID=UPI0011C8DF2A|nr:hypothetical protein [Paenibacillus sp. N3.4]TXK68909.1 hypothetical protein FU659_34335 [Paenibacillus sp. N3.4]